MRNVRLDPELDAWLQRTADMTGRGVSDVIREAILAWRRQREAGEIEHSDIAVEFDPAAPAIEDEFAEIAAEIPEEEWSKLPPDLLENLDHYLYGDDER